MTPIVLIPARLAATRLPNKPLADIGGVPMIVQVWRRAVESAVGRVVVATDHSAIADAVVAAGGEAVMTTQGHLSGSDRIHEALSKVDPDALHDVVINLQGDLPTITGEAIRCSLEPLKEPAVSVGTLIALIDRAEDRHSENVVKMIGTEIRPGHFRCLYFTRATAPSGEGPLWQHVGIYAWRRDALNAFVALPASPLELRERLEQLRAFEAGMRIDAMTVAHAPVGVDTAQDLARVRELFSPAGDLLVRGHNV